MYRILPPTRETVNSALPPPRLAATLPPVKLYHGTTAKIGRLALTEGLRPRVLTGKSNWKHFVESHPHLVYLSVCYGPYYALQTAKDLGKGKIAIVEVETDLLDEWNFRPDEDFVEQVTRLSKSNSAGIPGKSIDERTEYIRDHLGEFSDWWKRSVEFLGTCAYTGVIPPKAITRVAVVQTSKCKVMCFEANEPVISITNFRICGPQFRLLTKWFMGEPVTVEEWFQAQSVNALSLLSEKEKNSEIKKFSKILANQSCIEVITPSEGTVLPTSQRRKVEGLYRTGPVRRRP